MIFWAMVGYPLSIKLLGKCITRKNDKNYDLKPTVTLMIVAHNEESVILSKLKNAISLNYPKDKLKILVSSDNSTDRTNSIVLNFIKDNPGENISLYVVKERKGKTNAQNEAQKIVDTEFLVMTDANSILEKNSVSELMASFTSENIAYVTGCLKYINSNENLTAQSESSYWDSDVIIRDIESRIKTITAGNGALYAIRNKDYYDIPLIECHDSTMPLDFGLQGKRCINNLDAIAYEKAGEVNGDEFKRKVRMNRVLIILLKKGIRVLNIVKYGWFSYFYFGHRICRYLLWLNHILFYLTSLILMKENIIYLIMFVLQTLFFVVGLFGGVRMVNYYLMTILAQMKAIYNYISGNAKPIWEKAESTR